MKVVLWCFAGGGGIIRDMAFAFEVCCLKNRIERVRDSFGEYNFW